MSKAMDTSEFDTWLREISPTNPQRSLDALRRLSAEKIGRLAGIAQERYAELGYPSRGNAAATRLLLLRDLLRVTAAGIAVWPEVGWHPYAPGSPHQKGPRGRPVFMWRKGQKTRWYTKSGIQVGPEQSNVAPAVAAAHAAG